MNTTDGFREFVDVLTAAIRYELRTVSGQKYFRIHDSGDFWSPRYVDAWREIVRDLPDLAFWAPTQSWSIQKPAWQQALLALAAEPNIALSPSAIEIDDAPPVVAGYAAGSSVVISGNSCPAPSQGHRCMECRRCLDREAERTYKLH